MKINLLTLLALHICFAAVVAQPIITNQPQNQTAIAGTTVTFSVGATGAPPLSYQWRSHATATTFTNIPFGTEATLVLTNVQTTSRRFAVVVTDAGGLSVTSSPLATLTVLQPPPILVSASSVNGTEVGVCFSKAMGLAGLNSPANYQVVGSNGLASIASVGLWPGNTSVVLRLNTTLSGVFTVSAQGLTDAASNPILPGSTVTGRVWGAAISAATIGAPSPPGEFISCEEGRLSMRGGGTFLNPAPMQYLYELHTNDFDVQVRVDSMVKHGDPNGTGLDSPYLAFGGLMARNSLDPFSPSWWLAAAPTNGSRLIIFESRGWGDSAAGFPVWLRIRRSGSSFTYYYATNGTDWVPIGEPQPLRGAAAVMRVGLITIPFSEGVYATADYRDFGDTALAANASAMVAITRPPTNVTVEVNHPASFTAFASISGAPATDLGYQWQAETFPGSGVYTNVFFGTSPRFVTPPLTLADSGTRVRFVARVTGGPAVVSAPAAVTVVPDSTPPRVLSVTGRNGGSELVVTFSEAIDPSPAMDVFSYDGSDFGVIDAKIDGSATRVSLTLGTPIDLGTGPELSISGQFDAAGLPIDPNPSVLPVTAPVVDSQRGGARQDLFFGIGGTSISALRGDPRFPGSPDYTETVTQLEGPINIADNYGTLISGFLVPPVTGNYNFWMSSDDHGEFWLSTDENPANLVLICREPNWNAFRQYNSFAQRDPAAPENRSTTLFPAGIPLVTEQRYYFEGLSKEEGGGDNLSVAWQIPGGLAPVDGGSPIPGVYLAAPGSSVNALIQITRQPSNVVASPPGSTADHTRPLFTQNFTGTNGGFTTQQAGNPSGAWTHNAVAGVWSTDGTDNLSISEKLLMSPRLVVTQPGEVRLRFQHRFSFEEGMFDGGQARISVNGSPFTAVSRSAFNSNGYTGAIVGNGPLLTQPAFGNTSPGYASGDFLTSVATLGFFMPGDVLAIQFLGSWDYFIVASTPSWVIDSLEVTEGHPGQPNVKFVIEATALNLDAGAAPLSMVWQRDCGSGFTDIIGANQATYVFQPTQADSGCRFRCVLYTPGATATSQVATLNFALAAITMTRDGTELTLTWVEGLLQEAETVTGPWTDVAQATSPAHLPTTSAQRFFRLRSP